MSTNRADFLLTRIRSLADIVLHPGDDEPTDRAAAFLAAAILDLDTRLSAGGTPPEAWREGPDAPADNIGYEVGDTDPTPDVTPLDDLCGAKDDGYICTWSPGHRGAHVAGDGARVVAVWADR